MFLLGYYYGMDTTTFYNFPVAYRRWLIERINKEVTKAVEAGADIPTKGAHHNDPNLRAMLGKPRQFGMNGKTTRF